MFLSQRAHNQVLTMKKNVHLICHSSTRALFKMFIPTQATTGGECHCVSVCTHTAPVHIPPRLHTTSLVAVSAKQGQIS